MGMRVAFMAKRYVVFMGAEADEGRVDVTGEILLVVRLQATRSKLSLSK